MIYLAVVIIISLIITVCIVQSRANKNLYETWVRHLESYLDEEISQEDKTFLLPHIYEENPLSTKWAAFRYRELKNNQSCEE